MVDRAAIARALREHTERERIARASPRRTTPAGKVFRTVGAVLTLSRLVAAAVPLHFPHLPTPRKES